jgi:gluconolactonase
VKSCAGKTCTNIAFGRSERRQLYITESETGSVLVADLDVSGIALPR